MSTENTLLVYASRGILNRFRDYEIGALLVASEKVENGVMEFRGAQVAVTWAGLPWPSLALSLPDELTAMDEEKFDTLYSEVDPGYLLAAMKLTEALGNLQPVRTICGEHPGDLQFDRVLAGLGNGGGNGP